MSDNVLHLTATKVRQAGLESKSRARRGSMSNRSQTYVVLLRGINVGGSHRLLMADLRSTCARIGCERVRTYIQSGNVVLTASMSVESLERRLETAIEHDFGFAVPVLVRSAASWRRYVKDNPFANEATTQANWVMLCLSKTAPRATVDSDLEQYATQGERVIKKGDAIWIQYSNGIARSKLSPTVLHRHLESPVTTRNWRTVLKLDEMAEETAAR